MQVKFSGIMADVQQHVVLLTASVSSSDSSDKAMFQLKRQVSKNQVLSRGLESHMEQLQAAVALLRSSQATAADVDEAVADIHERMLELKDETVSELQHMCSSMQIALGEDLGMFCLRLTICRCSLHASDFLLIRTIV